MPKMKMEFLDKDKLIEKSPDKEKKQAFNRLPDYVRVRSLHRAEVKYRENAEKFEFGLAKKSRNK